MFLSKVQRCTQYSILNTQYLKYEFKRTCFCIGKAGIV
jgi:hypothetical protein